MTAPAHHRFLRAVRRERVDKIPLWLMRQAGRYMAEYRALRKDHPILEMIRTPELAAEVTLQPLRAFDLDAGIIFADILTLPMEMGLDLQFVAGEGPTFTNPIRSADDVKRLRARPAAEALGYTLDAIKLTVHQLNGRVPLIGFSGAPFTLACYAIQGEGSKEFHLAKAFMYNQPKAWHTLLDLFAGMIGDYLAEQVKAGAQVVQLFDSWAGLLGPEDYREYALPHSAKVISIVKQRTGAPVIHFGTETGSLLELIKQAGGDVIGVDWRTGLDEARRRLGPDVALQGNMDPLRLLGPREGIELAARRALNAGAPHPGYIFNIGHGIHKSTPPENVAALVEIVHGHPVPEGPDA
jgi:uroporphyrinogen decarboxylase